MGSKFKSGVIVLLEEKDMVLINGEIRLFLKVKACGFNKMNLASD